MTGRIIKGVGGLYEVKTQDSLYQCRARGVFRKQKITPLVGDLVSFQVVSEEEKEGYLLEIHERKNELIRPRISNVDQTLILMANQSPALNLDFLDRLIILIEAAGIAVGIGVNKLDLGDENQYEKLLQVYAATGYDIFSITAIHGEGIEPLKTFMQRKITVLAGPSGTGKSSVVNQLAQTVLMETGKMSEKIDRGKHTTRHAQLIEFYPESYVADTPGFTSISLDHIEKNRLRQYFREFAYYADSCRFPDCCHINEPDCAVKAQIGNEIHPVRYQHYLNYYQELKK